MYKHLTGLISAPLVPLNEDLTINYDIIPDYVDFLKRNGVVGAFVNGTNGSGMLLGLEQRKKVAEKWMDAAPSEFTIIIHSGHTSLTDQCILAKHAQDIGAFGFATMAPMFIKPSTEEQMANHCAREAAAAPDIPYYFYHLPSISGVYLSMRKFMELADEKIQNFAGIKFSQLDPVEANKCINYKSGKYNILWGHDENLLPAMTLGIRGAVGSNYNWVAPLYNNIMKNFLAGNLDKARKLQEKSIEIVNALFSISNFRSGSKEILRWLGLDLGPVMSPLFEISEKESQWLHDRLNEINFFDFANK